MSCYVNPKDMTPKTGEGTREFELLGKENGCVNGCCSGITLYTMTEYLTPGVHDDQEGFVVLEGTGWAKVGTEEFRIEPEVSLIAPAGTPHCFKRDTASKPVKLFWFHAAI